MKKSPVKLFRPADIMLPAAFSVAALLGRTNVSLWLFIALYGVRLCGLSASSGLRIAFSRQPAMRYVQGSAVMALILQLVGSLIVALILKLTNLDSSLFPLVICGLLLNIKHVFYEYLFSIGDESSATRCRLLTSILTLTGTLLCAPAAGSHTFISEWQTSWLLVTCGLSALIAAAVSLALGGKPRPKLNAEVLRCAPASMLQTGLWPVLSLALLRYLWPAIKTPLPLFLGLMLYEACRTPFRRAASEAQSMNRALLVICAAASLCGLIYYFLPLGTNSMMIPATCGFLILAALCAFAVYGSLGRKEREAL